MGLFFCENDITLVAVIIGLLSGLFYYIETPKRGWLYVIFFFLLHILSDYYWGIYTHVLGDEPEASAILAYFGWNVGYVFLIAALIHMEKSEVRRFFHPLMLLPVPLNIWQFILYLPYGGLANNIVQGLLLTVIAVICVRALIYYCLNRKNGAYFPVLHAVILIYTAAEYGMWTSSCFFWTDTILSPYYLFDLIGLAVMTQFAWSTGKDYEEYGYVYPDKNGEEKKFEIRLKTIAALVIIGGCVGGYYLAVWMKNMLSPGALSGNELSMFSVSLFIISIVFVFLILSVLAVIANHYRTTGKMRKNAEGE